MKLHTGLGGWVVPTGIAKQRDVVPSDTTTFTPSNIYTGSGGSIAIVTVYDDTVVTYDNVNPGEWWAMMAVKIMATGTTATGIKRGR